MKLAWICRTVSVPLQWDRQGLSTTPLVFPVSVCVVHANPEQVINVEFWTVLYINSKAINSVFDYVTVGCYVNRHHSVLGIYLPANRGS